MSTTIVAGIVKALEEVIACDDKHELTPYDYLHGCNDVRTAISNARAAIARAKQIDLDRADGRDQQLNVQLVDGVLTITLGVNMLKHAMELDERLQEYDESTGEFIHPEVNDVDVFAQALVSDLRQEEEDGTTLVHRMLDKAAINAIESGAEGILLPDDIRRARARGVANG